MGNQDQSAFKELEREEDKYIVDLKNLDTIKEEIEKYLPPAYTESSTKFVMINSIYLDTSDREFFKYHIYGKEDRIKIRIRKYGSNGSWNNKDIFLEIKEKFDGDVRKTRIQLDIDNADKARSGKKLEITENLEKLNKPFYSYGELSRFVSRYNRIVENKGLEPVLSITYKRLAYGKGNLRITLDTNLRFDVIKTTSLSNATKIKKSVDWKDVKEYGKRYDIKENAILEIKHNTALPSWAQNIIDENKLKIVSFSKYVWSTFHSLDYTLGT